MINDIPIITNVTIALVLEDQLANMLIVSSMFIERDSQNFDESGFDSKLQLGHVVASLIPW